MYTIQVPKTGFVTYTHTVIDDEVVMDVFVPKLSVLLERDPYLKNHEEELRKRYGEFSSLMYRMDQEGGLKQFSLGFKSFGAQV